MLKFKCPECGCGDLEEVMVNVTQSSTIHDIGDGGDINYSNTSSDGGEIDRYQCVSCGFSIKDNSGLEITDCDELYDWLVANQMVL